MNRSESKDRKCQKSDVDNFERNGVIQVPHAAAVGAGKM